MMFRSNHFSILLLFSRERHLLARALKKAERRLKEAVVQIDDERRHADQYKEQVRITRVLLKPNVKLVVIIIIIYLFIHVTIALNSYSY